MHTRPLSWSTQSAPGMCKALLVFISLCVKIRVSRLILVLMASVSYISERAKRFLFLVFCSVLTQTPRAASNHDLHLSGEKPEAPASPETCHGHTGSGQEASLHPSTSIRLIRNKRIYKLALHV